VGKSSRITVEAGKFSGAEIWHKQDLQYSRHKFSRV